MHGHAWVDKHANEPYADPLPPRYLALRLVCSDGLLAGARTGARAEEDLQIRMFVLVAKTAADYCGNARGQGGSARLSASPASSLE